MVVKGVTLAIAAISVAVLGHVIERTSPPFEDWMMPFIAFYVLVIMGPVVFWGLLLTLCGLSRMAVAWWRGECRRVSP